MSPDPNAPRYRVDHSGVLRGHIFRLGEAWRSLGIGAAFAATLGATFAALRTRPRTWGDPFLRLDRAELTVYHRVIDRMCVVYAVHDNDRDVFIRDIVPVLDHPLAGPA